MDPLLSATEMARWTAWKRASDTVLAAIARDIAAASDLSAADFAVLSRVREIGDGAMRQQELATLLGWQRSRLSRHVSRMQSRGLVVAVSEKGARMIKATEAGRAAMVTARPAHAAAVRRALFDAVPEGSSAKFWTGISSIAAREQEH